ncbi:ABC transporter domain-containing protein [Trichoderma breve]|uniref:ABC transporter domain-containing protein n=1 Tax=Trichoderma breve TaxID=2034170 RepID=A0A9W9E919_9HYPO|nr:ABC transporter domain-containing protein [Trichoderma breve]KAJ4862639.1 ABC transporter domain-containing protein [Trichoderma breve]
MHPNDGQNNGAADLEMNRIQSTVSANDIVSSLAWHNLSVVVKDHQTGRQLSILDKVCGTIKAGEVLAIMGPSGSGKTTLLNALAHRVAAAGATTQGDILVNGSKASLQTIRDLSSYVEQEDALIGSLTVRETMMFAARLSLPATVTKREAFQRVDDLIASFGLQSQAHTIVGTTMKKGLSGGQKKRLGVASRLVTNPKILFLDEPTSGLDSALSLEVCTYIKDIGRRHNLVIVASIHQPSSATFLQFDSLCLLSGGRTCYFGPISAATAYFTSIGHSIPAETNPAEYFLDLINTDLDKDGEIRRRTHHICQSWAASENQKSLELVVQKSQEAASKDILHYSVERSWIKSYRDIMAYGIRIVMYLGLAILMGTVFLQFNEEQKYVQPYINAIFFAFLEDFNTFKQERANGLVGPLAFLMSNFIIGLPFLFIITIIFSVVAYWLIGFRSDASTFFMWVLWLFLDLVAAESLVVLVSSVFNIFVVALAITAFANGLWMCVDGFLVPMNILNPFWKYAFHYIDYQAYVFQGMMYQCAYSSDLNSEGKFRGIDVLQLFSISTGLQGTWIGIIIGIIVGYRILAYLALLLRK